MNDADKWRIEKIIYNYGIFHLVCPENWTVWKDKCPECNAPIPEYLLIQRDLLNENR